MDLLAIGRVIRGRRAALGLSREEVARAVGLSAQTVGAWERGEIAPDPRSQSGLASLLQLPLGELALLIAERSAP